MNVKKSFIKKLIKECILETVDGDYLSDPNRVSDYIRQIYGNQPSVQDIVEYFSSEYGGQAKSRLVKQIIAEFMMHNPNFFIILPRNTVAEEEQSEPYDSTTDQFALGPRQRPEDWKSNHPPICPKCKIPIRQEKMPKGKVSHYCTACGTDWNNS